MSAPNIGFDDAVVDSYDNYLVPMIFEDYARDLARRTQVPSGARVLETAAGTGALTRQLRAFLPAETHLIATDLNPDMLKRAEQKLGDRGGVSFQTADATHLPFEDSSFDAVACQFGVMFYEDGAKGYREAARVLKRGGNFVFNIWDSLAENRLPEIAHRTLGTLLPEDPPKFLTIPFGYQDLNQIKRYLQEAGFSRMEISVRPGHSRSRSARSVAMGFLSGTPLGTALAEKGVLGRAMAAVEQAVAEEFGTGPVIAPMQSISFVAQKS